MIDNEIYKHIVMFSGGVCSWAAAKRVVERHGKDGVALLFADTLMEDEDLYRFLVEAVGNIFGTDLRFSLPLKIPPLERMLERKAYLLKFGADLMRVQPGFNYVADGRTPWDVMRDHHCLANSRFDMCSEELKRDLLNDWRNKHGDPNTTLIHLGLDWTEMHRVERANKLAFPWKHVSPMAEEPFIDKQEMKEMLLAQGIEPPRLYALGFAHNNCGGFCVKAGQAHFANLLRTMPCRYAWHEAQEEGMRLVVGEHSILKDRRGGVTKPLSLREFRLRLEAKGDYDKHEWGGCGCAIE